MLVYDTLTGNVKRFIDKLDNYDKLKINKNINVSEPYVLVTFTTGFGEVPNTTSDFLKENHKYLKAVAVSGNRNWGDKFGKAGDIISDKYNIPLLLKFELSGTDKDIDKFKQEVAFIEQNSQLD